LTAPASRGEDDPDALKDPNSRLKAIQEHIYEGTWHEIPDAARSSTREAEARLIEKETDAKAMAAPADPELPFPQNAPRERCVSATPGPEKPVQRSTRCAGDAHGLAASSLAADDLDRRPPDTKGAGQPARCLTPLELQAMEAYPVAYNPGTKVGTSLAKHLRRQAPTARRSKAWREEPSDVDPCRLQS
jgi:hypothetical protein